MDYEDFVIQFRARAAARMEEFEKALAKAQKETTAAKQSMQPIRTTPPAPGQVKHKTQVTPAVKKPVQPARGRARGRGPVQSVLRKA